MFLHVDAVKHIRDYTLLLTFNDGVSKEVDLANDLWGEVFEPLKDLRLFKMSTSIMRQTLSNGKMVLTLHPNSYMRKVKL